MRFLLVFLLLASQASATSVCVRTIDPQTRTEGLGTAVVLQKNSKGLWVAITARHVLEGATAEQTSVAIDDAWVPVKSIHRLDSDDDAAFFTFAHDREFKCPAVVDKDIGPGATIRWTGYSGGRKWEKFRATVSQVQTVGFATGETRPRQGQSGGGVYDHRGQLAGIVTGYTTDTGELIYVPICRVRRHCYRQWGFSFGVGIGPRPVIVAPPVYVAPPVIVSPAPVYVPPPRDVSPVDPDVAPPPPTDEPKPAKPDASAEIQRQLDELRELIKSLPGCNCINKDKSKPSANAGPVCKCPAGGCNGCTDGCKCDLSGVTTDIAKLKQPIRVQILASDGAVIDDESFPQGSPIKLKLSPIKK